MRTISEANPIVVMVQGCPFLAPLPQGDDSDPSLQHYPLPPTSLFPLSFQSTFYFISFPLPFPCQITLLLFFLFRFTSLSLTYQISRYATFKGNIIQGTHHPRDASTKGPIVGGTEHPRLFVQGHIGQGQVRNNIVPLDVVFQCRASCMFPLTLSSKESKEKKIYIGENPMSIPCPFNFTPTDF